MALLKFQIIDECENSFIIKDVSQYSWSTPEQVQSFKVEFGIEKEMALVRNQEVVITGDTFGNCGKLEDGVYKLTYTPTVEMCYKKIYFRTFDLKERYKECLRQYDVNVNTQTDLIQAHLLILQVEAFSESFQLKSAGDCYNQARLIINRLLNNKDQENVYRLRTEQKCSSSTRRRI